MNESKKLVNYVLNDFIEHNKYGNNDLSEFLKATVAQFLIECQQYFFNISSENNTSLKDTQVLNVQIKSLQK